MSTTQPSKTFLSSEHITIRDLSFFIIFLKIFIYLSFWLHQVLVVARGIFRCGTWALRCSWALRSSVRASL